MAFPSNFEEFETMLEAYDVENKDDWLYGSFSSEDVVAYLFLKDIWDSILNPNDVGWAKLRLDCYNRAALNSDYDNSEIIPPGNKVLQTLLDVGVSEKDISTVIRDFQIEAVYSVFFAINQPQHENQGIDINFTMMGNVDGVDLQNIDVSNNLSELFMSAKPKKQPKVKHHV